MQGDLEPFSCIDFEGVHWDSAMADGILTFCRRSERNTGGLSDDRSMEDGRSAGSTTVVGDAKPSCWRSRVANLCGAGIDTDGA